MLLTLNDPDYGGPERVGWKGERLYWLSAHGFPAPKTWVLPAELFRRAQERAGVADDVTALSWNLRGLWNDLRAVRRVLEGEEERRVHIARVLRSAVLPDSVGRDLEWLVLRDTLWAVRASPVADLPSCLFPPALAVPGPRLWDAVTGLWARVVSREVLRYCGQMDLEIPALAVLLQPMVRMGIRDRSGVVYSASPDRHHAGPMVQAVFGLWPGEDHGPACVRVAGRWVWLEERARPDAALVVGPEGGVIPARPYPAGEPLTEEEADRLTGLAAQVSAQWGTPVETGFLWPERGHPLLSGFRPLDTIRLS